MILFDAGQQGGAGNLQQLLGGQPGVDLRWPASSIWRPGEPAVNTVSVADVKKSRSVSYCCTLLAKAPEDCGPAAILIDRICSKIAEDTLRSSALSSSE